MKKIGIVSSFDVMCGNATYAKALVEGVSQEYECVPISLPVSIQDSHDDVSLNEIIKKTRLCDMVNIQMELGLYGPTPGKALKLIKKIIKNSKIISITMHRVEDQPQNLLKKVYRDFKTFGINRAMLSLVKAFIYENVFIAYRKIILLAYRKNATFIVHTYREKDRIQKICPDAKILVHPIVWPENLPKNNRINLRKKFKNDLPIIGLFGFVSEYKNFEQVIRVSLLSDFNVLLAGGTHPKSQNYGQRNKTSTFHKISELIADNFDKVHIYTSPNDYDLIGFMSAVDLIIVPYFETGQSGSGIAGLAIQYGKRVIFSDTCLVAELLSFLNKNPYVFDVNSDASLVSAIKESLQHDRERELSFSNYNFKTNIDTYLLSLGIEG